MATTSLTAGLPMSRRSKWRRRFVNGALGDRQVTVLEIGALDNPTYRKEEGSVFFADFFSREESLARHQKAASRNTDNIVSVDFILRDRNLSDAVTITPDLIVANHVIEHIPDPISWLEDLRNISKAGSYLFMSVPDKRFTFDEHRALSDAVDWLRARDEGLQMPSYYNILRHMFYHNMRYGKISIQEAQNRAAALSGKYTDVHCSVFTAESFDKLVHDLGDEIPWTMEKLAEPESMQNEFRVLLRAT